MAGETLACEIKFYLHCKNFNATHLMKIYASYLAF